MPSGLYTAIRTAGIQLSCDTQCIIIVIIKRTYGTSVCVTAVLCRYTFEPKYLVTVQSCTENSNTIQQFSNALARKNVLKGKKALPHTACKTNHTEYLASGKCAC